MLGRIQHDLFDLVADLAVPQREGKAERLRVVASQVERLEHEIDALNENLAPLTSFVLPRPASFARAECRARFKNSLHSSTARTKWNARPRVMAWLNSATSALPRVSTK